MRIEIDAPARVKAGTECRIRVILLNDSYEPVTISRNAFVGPNVAGVTGGRIPRPESVEPTFGQAETPLELQPFTYYGRERSFGDLTPGAVEISAYYNDPHGGIRVEAARVKIRVDKA